MFLIKNLMFLSKLSSSVGLVSEVFKNSWTVPLKPKLNPPYPRHNRHTIEHIDHSVRNNHPRLSMWANINQNHIFYTHEPERGI